MIVIDLIIAKAVQLAIMPTLAPVFRPSVFGFRPERSIQGMLLAIEKAAMERSCWVIAQDDIRAAFDNVPIADSMADFRQHIGDADLLWLIEALLRGADGQGRTVGIDQGNAVSPVALLLRLHYALSLPQLVLSDKEIAGGLRRRTPTDWLRLILKHARPWRIALAEQLRHCDFRATEAVLARMDFSPQELRRFIAHSAPELHERLQRCSPLRIACRKIVVGGKSIRADPRCRSSGPWPAASSTIWWPPQCTTRLAVSSWTARAPKSPVPPRQRPSGVFSLICGSVIAVRRSWSGSTAPASGTTGPQCSVRLKAAPCE
jgi:hypothetical protein